MVNKGAIWIYDNMADTRAMFKLYYFETLLWSRDVNTLRLCYVNNEVDSVTPCLTCYGKQRRHFEFLTIWRTRALCLNLTSCYFGLWRYRHFDFTVIWRIRAVYLNLTCCYLGICATAIFEFLFTWRLTR